MNERNEKSAAVLTTVSSPNTSFDHVPVRTLETRPTFWPSDAKALARSPRDQWSLVVYDIVLTLTPLALVAKIILVIVAARIDHDNKGENFDQVHPLTVKLVDFNSQLATLFTIVFVSIISTLVRRIARWRAQQGATVAELEQWQASTSLPSTIKTIWSLRMFTVTSFGLVAVWSWYYLGSQAAIREYTLQASAPYSHVNITFTNTQGPSTLDADHFQSLKNSLIAANNAQFTVAINVTFLNLGYDPNGFLLLPQIDQVTSEDPDHQGFLNTKLPDEMVYASQAGLLTYAVFPGLGFVRLDKVVGQLVLNTSYLAVDCAPAQPRNLSEFPSGVLDSMSVSVNMTAPSNELSDEPASFEIWYRASDNTAPIQAISATCSVTTVPLQIQATCLAQGCVVKKLKPILIDPTTSYNTVFKNATFAARFFDQLLLSTGVPSDQNDTTIAEGAMYLPGPYDNMMPGTNAKPFVTDIDILTDSLPTNIGAVAAAHNLSIDDAQAYLRQNLQKLAAFRSSSFVTPTINTYLNVFQQAQTYDIIKSEHPKNTITVLNGSIPSPWLSIGQLDGARWEPQYTLSVPWLVVDFISCGILLLAGITAGYLRTQILAPDVFGYVSSMTRDNPHIHLAQPGSTLDGMDRARLLKKVKVQLVDVEGNQETGRVGLAQTDGGWEAHASQLSKHRLYR